MASQKHTFVYGKDHLSVGTALDLCRHQCSGILSEKAKQQISASQKAIEKITTKGETVYGVNTGFGPLCNTKISDTETQKLQHNILRSHSVGVGAPISSELAKLMLILKVHSLAQGYSGVRLETIERILWHIEEDIIPLVPAQGSVGASGDLAPLAHLFLPLIGTGKVFYHGRSLPTAEVLKKENLSPLQLGPKEGLALINGTQFIAAHAVVILDRLLNCLESADIIGAMTLEALMGSAQPFDSGLHELRPYSGCQHVAHRLSILLQESEILASHAQCDRVQDPYSLRCIPQVHGASYTAWLHLKELTEIEINSVTDNPIIFDEGKTISGGNFHGQPLALPLDYVAVAAAEVGNISDRRTYLSLEGELGGLPKLLLKNTGINSGFMLPQYTSAALVSENKSLCFPASADSIPTSLGQEDHVSMGSISGRKTLQIIGNLENILAVELLCAAQAFDFRRPLKSGKILEACHAHIRQHIDHAEEDRIFAQDIAIAHDLIFTKKLVEIAHQIAQQNQLNLDGEHHEHFRLH